MSFSRTGAVIGLAFLLGWAGLSNPVRAGNVLDGVLERDAVRCGVNTGLAGFAVTDDRGRWTGLDVAYCRAVAAAVLGDSEKVEFVPLSAQARFTALQTGVIDILSRNTTWTLTRDASLGLHFAGVMFYDGQGFMVPAELGVTSVHQLDGAAICVQSGTTTELNLADFFRTHGMEYQPVVFEGYQETLIAFFGGRCQVYTTDMSGLAAIRAVDAPRPEDYVILPETISEEPLGPVVQRGDDQWFAIAKWVLFALLQAEANDVTSANARTMKTSSENPVIQRLLGASGSMGAKLGLDAEWALRAISQVGNYGEIFRRNVGAESPIGLERGRNALWADGGLMYPMPIR